MGIRQDQAESVTSLSSTPHCVQCGAPVVKNHRCPATPSTSRLQGPPAGWREQVEEERRSPRLDHDDDWQEEPLPLDPIEPPRPEQLPPP